MAETVYTLDKVVAAAGIVWSNNGNAQGNGVETGSTFTLTGTASVASIVDDDSVLQDNINNVDPYQSLDPTLQVLTANFGSNFEGDYVWSRYYQDVVDSYGNVGRIYQIRMGTYGGSGMPDTNSTNVNTYYAFSGDIAVGPGVTYTVIGERQATGDQAYSEFEKPVCFLRGTLLETDRGPVAIEDIRPGTLVLTLDHGLRPVVWIGSRILGGAANPVPDHLRPILIRAGALGGGCPSTDLRVSPQHRIFVRSEIAQRMFAQSEVLVAAKMLLGGEGVEIDTRAERVEYFHLMFDRHEIVFSNGAATESLYFGPEARLSLGDDHVGEILALLPQLRAAAEGQDRPEGARPFVPGRLARKLAARHAKNSKELVTARS